jgi:ELWxxDGT repeat protein
VKDIFPGTGSSLPDTGQSAELEAVGDRLFFGATDPEHGEELWISDGTPEGTALLADIVPGIGGSAPGDFTLAGPRLFFAAQDPAYGRELWVLPLEGLLSLFRRGDCDGDGQVTGVVTDAIFLLSFNFLGGARPPCLAACDSNGDGSAIGTVTDAVYLLSFNFLGGPPPPAPFPECGVIDLERDAVLGCDIPLAVCP